MIRVRDVRDELQKKYERGEFVTVGTSKTVEIAPAFFLADEPSIFGIPNQDYIDREKRWYNSMSLNVNDIPGGTPEIWKRCATPDGRINSNYGWAIHHHANGSQYDNVRNELKRDPNSRRGVMIYTRPSMHVDQNVDGMQDFMCTNTVQYFIRDGRLHCLVNMRSNDAVFGYNNDWPWQAHVLHLLAVDLGVYPGDTWWCAGSLHVYERHFSLFSNSGSGG